MRFKDEVNRIDSTLLFLIIYGFKPKETCSHGCCKGWHRGYWSSEARFYNRITVWADGNYIRACNHKEFACGDGESKVSNCINFKGATREDVIELIDKILPDNLD